MLQILVGDSFPFYPMCSQVRNPASGYCLDSLGAKPEHSARMGVYICHGQGGNQVGIN